MEEKGRLGSNQSDIFPWEGFSSPPCVPLLIKRGKEKKNSYKGGGILHYFSLPFARGR
jgi:hypothetical protein